LIHLVPASNSTFPAAFEPLVGSWTLSLRAGGYATDTVKAYRRAVAAFVNQLSGPRWFAVNIADMKSALESRESRPDGYQILEALDENTWCIRKQGKTRLAFYVEHGTKCESQRFKQEGAACEYFYNRLVHG
jgi:hypothetical protein